MVVVLNPLEVHTQLKFLSGRPSNSEIYFITNNYYSSYAVKKEVKSLSRESEGISSVFLKNLSDGVFFSGLLCELNFLL